MARHCIYGPTCHYCCMIPGVPRRWISVLSDAAIQFHVGLGFSEFISKTKLKASFEGCQMFHRLADSRAYGYGAIMSAVSRAMSSPLDSPLRHWVDGTSASAREQHILLDHHLRSASTQLVARLCKIYLPASSLSLCKTQSPLLCVLAPRLGALEWRLEQNRVLQRSALTDSARPHTSLFKQQHLCAAPPSLRNRPATTLNPVKHNKNSNCASISTLR